MADFSGASGSGGGGRVMEIGWPTDVHHVNHVTFDRFDGFLGLPVEFEPEVSRRAPSARLWHRGPDWSGLHHHQECYLSHQRLAIVDPTSGDQPLYNKDKTVVVTMGRRYFQNNCRKQSRGICEEPIKQGSYPRRR